MKRVVFFIIFSIIILFTGCVTTRVSDVYNLSVGMTPNEVGRIMGQPVRILSTSYTQDGMFEVFEYQTYRNESYAVEFLNGRMTGYDFMYENVSGGNYPYYPNNPNYIPQPNRPVQPGRPSQPNRPSQPSRPSEPSRPGNNSGSSERPSNSGSTSRPSTGSPNTRPTNSGSSTRPAENNSNSPSTTRPTVRPENSSGTTNSSSASTRSSSRTNTDQNKDKK
ncbi:hypothetical protein GGR21_002013 [Dysgonomonas hofstadii]|uniref:Uncharacterized protein n=1 Tax=Dysgonomonas hofstadii TaxID=637886 RepID=A0A840CUE5_9BACT|nr:hypothetical protein [Dysgonomonas hofstadii]MBB4036112.1 hypothetical protein [Dysgonomonas hofstadii]